LARTLLTVTPSAAEGTTQVRSSRVAGIGEELDTAVSAVRQAEPQFGLRL
jgi:hypothetical protein